MANHINYHNNLFTRRNPFAANGDGSSNGSAASSEASDGPMVYDDERYNDLARLSSSPMYGRRSSVSAESMKPTGSSRDNWSPPRHAKSPEQRERLLNAIKPSFLFRGLDDEQLSIVLEALVEKPVPASNIKIISQGGEGDYFYIIESGTFDVYINPTGRIESGPDGMGEKVGSMGEGESFGELALMYNAPRAATIVSASPGKSTLWALDRITFRRILMETAFNRRRMYENFLGDVSILSSLEPYERSKIADALQTVEYPPHTTIIREGDPGDCLYFLERGQASVYKSTVENPAEPVMVYKTKGDYFGELALLDDKPRAASVYADTAVKLVKLDRDGFKRLLGPVQPLMRRHSYDVAQKESEC